MYAYVSGQTLKATDPVGLAPEFEFTKRNDLERRAYSGGVTGLFNSLVESVKEVVSFAAAPVDPVEMKNPELRKQYGSAARSLERVAHKVKLPGPTDAAGRGGYRAGQGAGTVLDVAAAGVGGAGLAKAVVRGVSKRLAKRPPSLSKQLDEVLTRNLDALGGPGGVCFVAGTPVVTARGLVPIEEVQVGDLVLSKSDDGQGDNRWQPVKTTFQKPPSATLDIRFQAEGGRVNDLGVTPNHPFWKRGVGWVEAGDLRVGNQVWSLNRGWLTVVKVRLRSDRRRVYNLEVDEDHTYAVGTLAVWVHNQNCKGISAKDIKGARPFEGGRPGHPDAHGVSREDMASIMNDPKSSLYTGKNSNSRPVDFYHREGTTVITEQGDPTRVITAYGKNATKNHRGQPIERGTGKAAPAEPNQGKFTKVR